jgi:RNA polymerase sigma-70 factor (ECF subfamily)
MDWNEASDADLLRAIGEQETVAFNTLFDRYSRLVFSTAYRVLNDAGAAEDVVQDVYVRLWQRPERYVEERGRFIGWLLSVTRNRAIDEIRSRSRRPLSETLISGGDVTSSITVEAPSRSAERELESAKMVDQREAVCAALDELPYDQRIAIELTLFQGPDTGGNRGNAGYAVGHNQDTCATGDAQTTRRSGGKGRLDRTVSAFGA